MTTQLHSVWFLPCSGIYLSSLIVLLPELMDTFCATVSAAYLKTLKEGDLDFENTKSKSGTDQNDDICCSRWNNTRFLFNVSYAGDAGCDQASWSRQIMSVFLKHLRKLNLRVARNRAYCLQQAASFRSGECQWPMSSCSDKPFLLFLGKLTTQEMLQESSFFFSLGKTHYRGKNFYLDFEVGVTSTIYTLLFIFISCLLCNNHELESVSLSIILGYMLSLPLSFLSLSLSLYLSIYRSLSLSFLSFFVSVSLSLSLSLSD